MYDLNDHYYFVQAVDHGGFAAAGRALDLPKSTLSRRVIALETRLAVRLIERTSRSFVVTEVGRAFYEHAKAILIEAQAAEEVVARRMAAPAGTIRLTCSVGMARFISPIVVSFLRAYPSVNLVQHTTNRNVDLIEEGFDVGLRGHSQPLPDSNLVQRPVVQTPWQLFAAPAYLQQTNVPGDPRELESHGALCVGSGIGEVTWQLTNSERQVTVPVQPKLLSTDMETLKAAAVAGMGIVSLPAYLAAGEVDRGELVQVLPNWISQQAQVSLLTPYRRSQLPAVRALIDFFAQEFPLLVNAANPAEAAPGQA